MRRLTAIVAFTPNTRLLADNNMFRLGEDASLFTLGNVSPIAAKPTALRFSGETEFRRVNPFSETQLNLAIAADRIANEGNLTFAGGATSIAINARGFDNSPSGQITSTNDFFTLKAGTFTNNGMYKDIGTSTYTVTSVFNNGTFLVPKDGNATFEQVANAPRAMTSRWAQARWISSWRGRPSTSIWTSSSTIGCALRSMPSSTA